MRADRLVYSYCATYGLPAVILRPFNNYGPRQHLEKVVPRFITSLLLNEKLTVHGGGAAARDFLYVDDTCRAIDALMHADAALVDGEVFNAGSGEDRCILAIARDLLRALGGDESSIERAGERPGQVMRHTADSSKIKRVLGWEPKVGWEQGLRQTIDWFNSNRDWWERNVDAPHPDHYGLWPTRISLIIGRTRIVC